MMTLYGSPASPYARVVRVLLIEKGMGDRFSWLELDAMSDPRLLQAANPLMQVPTLVLDGGASLFDTDAICAHVDTLAEPQLLVTAGDAGGNALRRRALARGLLDASVRTVQELRRPEVERSQMWLDRWRRAMERALAAIDAELPMGVVGDVTGDVAGADFSVLTVVIAAEYVSFRVPEVSWRTSCPRLARVVDQLADRRSLVATRPG